jgi:hypothetical protein
MSKYNLQLVKLLLNSIDDVEMRRLKEGFYSLLKLATLVKDKGPDVKADLISFSQSTKLDKPQTQAII